MRTIVTVLTILTAIVWLNFRIVHNGDYDEVYLNKEPIYENLFATLTYGDTLRIEIEKAGDTLIKHYIDIKGGSDDAVDDSYDVKCTYEYVVNNPTLPGPYHTFKGEGYTISYNKQALINLCDSMIASDTTGYYYKGLKDVVIPPPPPKPVKWGNGIYVFPVNYGCCSLYSPDYKMDLLTQLKPLITDTITGEKPNGIMIERFNVPYGTSENHYLIFGNKAIPFQYHYNYKDGTVMLSASLR